MPRRASSGSWHGSSACGGATRPAGRSPSTAGPAVARLVELLREIGAGHDGSPSQVALRWLIQQEGVLPIPGAKNASQAT
jgi:aryl-alcohol dehydrogenase-like predicted oxidoreductase